MKQAPPSLVAMIRGLVSGLLPALLLVAAGLAAASGPLPCEGQPPDGMSCNHSRPYPMLKATLKTAGASEATDCSTASCIARLEAEATHCFTLGRLQECYMPGVGADSAAVEGCLSVSKAECELSCQNFLGRGVCTYRGVYLRA